MRRVRARRRRRTREGDEPDVRSMARGSGQVEVRGATWRSCGRRIGYMVVLRGADRNQRGGGCEIERNCLPGDRGPPLTARARLTNAFLGSVQDPSLPCE